MLDPELLAGLQAAVESDPDNVPLRLHLAHLLLASAGEESALNHYIEVLARDPLNALALEGAAKACDALGDSGRAASYRALLAQRRKPGQGAAGQDATAPSQPTPPTPPPTPGTPKDLDPVAVPIGDDKPAEWWDVERAGITLADVGGMEDVKRRLHVSFIGPMRSPEITKAYGKSLRGGLLLWGPPGCGKTYIARATAGELGASFIGVGLPDILTVWFGQSEAHLHELFQTARRNAPCVLFFDEMDALGQRRSNLRYQPTMRNVVNQLLAEMDGLDSNNEGIFVLGATNHPWDVDSALLRPGRFDRAVLVLPPDSQARAAILSAHLRGKPVANVDVRRLAGETEMFSGADLRFLVESATERALEESLATGKVRNVTGDDFRAALRELKPSTRAWFETAENFALFANDGGRYDDLLKYMRAHKML